MEYAIVQIGGKQYKASVGQTLVLENLKKAVGEIVEFDHVVLHSDNGKITTGQPFIAGLTVTGKIQHNNKGRKVAVLRFRAKSHYHKNTGMRPHITHVVIEAIGKKSAKQS